VPPEKEFGNSLAVNVPAVKQEKDGYAERLQVCPACLTNLHILATLCFIDCPYAAKQLVISKM
jgi:hypothetical protein